MGGIILKEIKSNHWFPRKEEVDEYLGSRDKDEYKKKSILSRSLVTAGAGATGAILGGGLIVAQDPKVLKNKKFYKILAIGTGASALGAGIGGALTGHIRNKKVERLARDPQKYEKEFPGSKYPTDKEIRSYIYRNS